jgi:hypothetical protein
MTDLEDAPDIFDFPAEDDERVGYRLRSLSHLTWAMRKLRDLRLRRLDIHTTAQAEIDRVQRWAADEDEKLTRDADWFRSLIEAYALDLRARDERQKSVTTPYGVVRTRMTGAPWNIDEATFLAWLAEHRPDLVKTTRAVRLADAKRAFGLTVQDGLIHDPASGEAVPGVKVGEPSITASVDIDLDLHADEEDE